MTQEKTEKKAVEEKSIPLISIHLGKDADGKDKYFQIWVPEDYTKEDLEEVFAWFDFLVGRFEKRVQK